jgi:integrase
VGLQMYKSYTYESVLAPYIEGLISEKRTLGYSYEFEAYILKKFDEYCISHNLKEPVITHPFIEDWEMLRHTESKGYRGQRVSFVRQLSLYMNSLGIMSYISRHFTDRIKRVPHLLSEAEIMAFFDTVDSYWPNSNSNVFHRMAIEYRVLFRLIYCCGLRNSEACGLQTSQVNLKDGFIMIIHSKGDKDRIVYISQDLQDLCREYVECMQSFLGQELYWFFPSRNPEKPLPKTSVDARFNENWSKTPYAESCAKKPTVHCLRHAYVVKRMNSWMEQGLDLNVMMPYLSKFLGHKGRNETFYYFHQVEEAFSIIRKKDSLSNRVIPEVNLDE